MANTTTFGGSDKSGYDMSLWYESRPLKIGWFAMLAAVGSEVVFHLGGGDAYATEAVRPCNGIFRACRYA